MLVNFCWHTIFRISFDMQLLFIFSKCYQIYSGTYFLQYIPKKSSYSLEKFLGFFHYWMIFNFEWGKYLRIKSRINNGTHWRHKTTSCRFGESVNPWKIGSIRTLKSTTSEYDVKTRSVKKSAFNVLQPLIYFFPFTLHVAIWILKKENLIVTNIVRRNTAYKL